MDNGDLEGSTWRREGELRSGRALSALRREVAVYRRTLDAALALAVDRLIATPDDVVAHKLTEIVAPVLRRKRPSGAKEC